MADIVIGALYVFHTVTEPTEVRVVPDGTVVKVLREVEALDDEHRMYEVVAEGDDDTFPAFDDELTPVEN